VNKLLAPAERSITNNSIRSVRLQTATCESFISVCPSADAAGDLEIVSSHSRASSKCRTSTVENRGASALRTGVRMTTTKLFSVHSHWATNAVHEKKKPHMCRERSRVTLATAEDAPRGDVVLRRTMFHWFLIHPNSMKRLCWDVVSISLLASDIVVIPFVGAFDPPKSEVLLYTTWATMLFWTLDMGATMLTGYQDGKDVVVDFKRIALRYLKSWFALDCLIVGLDWVLFWVGRNEAGTTGGSAARLGRSLRTLRFVRTLRLIRLFKIKRILHEIQDMINTETLSICFGIVKIIICLVLANHIVACCWYGIGTIDNHAQGLSSWIVAHELENKELSYRYTTSLHWSLTQFTPASMEVVPCNVKERIFAVVVLLVAMITFSSFVSILTASMAELRKISSDETRQFWLLRRYLKDWGVSTRIAIRIQRYLEYAYQKQRQRVQVKDVQLLALLSEPLMADLKHATLMVHLAGHPMFRACDNRARIFATSLAEMSLARGDLIFLCGEQASAMYFVVAGTLQFQLGELCEEVLAEGSVPLSGSTEEYLNEGEWACEAPLWTTWLHLGDLQGYTEAQIISINAARFGEAIQVHKPVWICVRKYANKFVEALNKLTETELTDLTHQVLSSAEIVEESEFVKLDVEDLLEYEEITLSRLRKDAWSTMRRFTGLDVVRGRGAGKISPSPIPE